MLIWKVVGHKLHKACKMLSYAWIPNRVLCENLRALALRTFHIDVHKCMVTTSSQWYHYSNTRIPIPKSWNSCDYWSSCSSFFLTPQFRCPSRSRQNSYFGLRDSGILLHRSLKKNSILFAMCSVLLQQFALLLIFVFKNILPGSGGVKKEMACVHSRCRYSPHDMWQNVSGSWNQTLREKRLALMLFFHCITLKFRSFCTAIRFAVTFYEYVKFCSLLGNRSFHLHCFGFVEIIACKKLSFLQIVKRYTTFQQNFMKEANFYWR